MTYSILKFRSKLAVFIIAIIAVLGLGTSPWATVPTAAAKPTAKSKPRPTIETYDAKVVRIIDGDTVVVLTGAKTQAKLRLYGIDAPEKKQAFGSRSREFLASLIFGCAVMVEPISTDQYGRTIARIHHEGRDIGLAMISAGMAWHYSTYAPKDIDYKNAMIKARTQKLGLWSDEFPVEPWKFRAVKVIK